MDPQNVELAQFWVVVRVEVDILSAHVIDVRLVPTVEPGLVRNLPGLAWKNFQLDLFSGREDDEAAIRIVPPLANSLPRSPVVEAHVD
mmetsp:Transcript_42000/g.164564  ORF Transcript_42000/g.164564 Transcript_42000/m.164564 type:complete len:88 (-) Transcript_42000:228-491(-)